MAYKEWIDSHCHLSSLSNPKHELELAEQAGIDGFVTIALNRAELDLSRELETPSSMIFAGVHPYYSATQSRFIDNLPYWLDTHVIEGIGEIGLDKRNKDLIWQRDVLLQQLDIADQFNVPVSLHCVKMYYELFKLIKVNFQGVRGVIHGFTGSIEIVKEFSHLDIAFGLNPGILVNSDIQEVVSYLIEHNKLLLETDAPNTHNSNFQMKENGLSQLPVFAELLADSTGITLSRLKESQLSAFKEFIQFN